MAIVDMPLNELENYQGINPCPADFDDYWNKALKEMDATDSAVELKPADFECSFADCFDMYFTGVRGAKIYTKLLMPKKRNNCPAVLQFHGYSGVSGQWIEYLGYAAQGFIVAALDCRGQGGKSQDTTVIKGNTLQGHIVRGLCDKPENLLFRQIFLDTAQLAKIISEMDEVDENRIVACGGSQGGGLTLACAALSPLIKKAAPQFPFLCDYQRMWEMDLRTGAYKELWDHFRRVDPKHEKANEIFTVLGYIDIQHLAKRITADILIAVGLTDDICPPSTQFAVYNKITSNKKMEVYPHYGHESLPGFSDQAFQWLSEIC